MLSIFFSYGDVKVRFVTSSMIVFMFMLYDMSTGEKLKKVLMYVLSSQGQEISMVLYSCCNSAKYMFIISHRGQVKETADVSAVISKVSNMHFTLSFSILRCSNAAMAQNICFLWCINNSVIAQNICLCLCPILCPIGGK